MLTLPSSLRVFAKTGPTDMRNYAVSLIMWRRPLPTQRKHDSRATGAIG